MPSRRLFPSVLALFLAACGGKPAVSPPSIAGKGALPASQDPLKKTAVTGESAPELVQKALRALNSGDAASAAHTFERVLAIEPANREALWRLAIIAQRSAMEQNRPLNAPFYLRSAEFMRKLLAVAPDLDAEQRSALPTILYNEARSLALRGESARALRALSDALNAGFEGLEHIDADDDLNTLRKLPEFQALLRRLEHRRVVAMLAASRRYPFDVRLKTLDDKPFHLADLHGKVTVVQFWGPWCSPSRKILPHLTALYQRYRERGLEVVALSYQNQEPDEARKTLETYVRETKLPYPCLIGDEATRTQVPGFPGYPTTLFIDRAGKVRLTLPGYQPYSALESAALALLGEENAEQTPKVTKPSSDP